MAGHGVGVSLFALAYKRPTGRSKSYKEMRCVLRRRLLDDDYRPRRVRLLNRRLRDMRLDEQRQVVVVLLPSGRLSLSDRQDVLAVLRHGNAVVVEQTRAMASEWAADAAERRNCHHIFWRGEGDDDRTMAAIASCASQIKDQLEAEAKAQLEERLKALAESEDLQDEQVNHDRLITAGSY